MYELTCSVPAAMPSGIAHAYLQEDAAGLVVRAQRTVLQVLSAHGKEEDDVHLRGGEFHEGA